MAVGLQRGDRLAHRLDVLIVGRARHLLGLFQAQGRGILAEAPRYTAGVVAQRHASPVRLGDRPVVHVGEVRDMVHVEAGLVAEHGSTSQTTKVRKLPMRPRA